MTATLERFAPMTYTHQPVLLAEVESLLITDRGGLYLDATLGLGGHSEAILRAISPAGGRLLGLDMDPEALESASARLETRASNFTAARSNFRNLARVLDEKKHFPLAGALFDIGVSSLQFDKPERGFSFMHEGPLDMRMDPSSSLTAAAIVNTWPAEQLALLFKEFGEEREAMRIARAIEARRRDRRFSTTTELAAHIEKVMGRREGIHPATRVFQALRIAVNAELENLTRGLESVLPYMQQGGRIAVITFHSLEDRIVKNVFSSFVEQGLCRLAGEAKQPIRPSDEEVERNPRSRSAKLRIVEKL